MSYEEVLKSMLTESTMRPTDKINIYEVIIPDDAIIKVDIEKEMPSGVSYSSELLEKMRELMPQTIGARHYYHTEYRRHVPYNAGRRRPVYDIDKTVVSKWVQDAYRLIPSDVCDTMYPITERLVDRINSCKNGQWKAEFRRRSIDSLDVDIYYYENGEHICSHGFFVEQVMTEDEILALATKIMNGML